MNEESTVSPVYRDPDVTVSPLNKSYDLEVVQTPTYERDYQAAKVVPVSNAVEQADDEPVSEEVSTLILQFRRLHHQASLAYRGGNHEGQQAFLAQAAAVRDQIEEAKARATESAIDSFRAEA